jgi:hypothetical protein
MDAAYSPDTCVHFQHTTWYYIPEDRTIHNYYCGNFSSCIFFGVFQFAVINRTLAG